MTKPTVDVAVDAVGVHISRDAVRAEWYVVVNGDWAGRHVFTRRDEALVYAFVVLLRGGAP